MIGVGIQQCFILLFLLFAVKFHRMVLLESRKNIAYSPRIALTLLWTIYTVLVLITVGSPLRMVATSHD
jgi:hypothetical protein